MSGKTGFIGIPNTLNIFLFRPDIDLGATIEALLPSAYDDVSKSLYKWAALSLQAHLEKLVADGELRCEAGRYSS